MSWKFFAIASVFLFVVSGLIYWFSNASVYAVNVAPWVDVFTVSPDRDYLAIAYGGEVMLYTSSGVLEWSKSLNDDVCAAAFSPDGYKLAVFAGSRLYFLSAADGSVVKEVAMTLSCAPSSNIYWAPSGGAVLVSARGRLAYVTVAGRGELTPYVGLTITRLKWLSDTEAIAIDDFGNTAYLIEAVPLTVNTLAVYGGRGSAGFFDDGVFVIDSKGWAALIRPDGPSYNRSLGEAVTASNISGLGFAVVGSEVLAIDPSDGDIVWRASLGEPISSAEVRACGGGAAVEVSHPLNGGFARETRIFVGGEDILEKAGLPRNSVFLAWFGDCSAALVFDATKPETYIVRIDGSTEPLGGIYSPATRVGNSLIVHKFREENPHKTSGVYLLRPDGTMSPIIGLDYSTVRPINERTILVISPNGAKIVKLGEAPPQYSWAWIAPALLGTAFAAGAAWRLVKERRK